MMKHSTLQSTSAERQLAPLKTDKPLEVDHSSDLQSAVPASQQHLSNERYSITIFLHNKHLNLSTTITNHTSRFNHSTAATQWYD